MAFTRDWDKALKLDHSKFKTQPGYIRDLMDDLDERLTSFIYGFASGETLIGMKKGKFITIGTGTPTAPIGTGVATEYDLYARANGTAPAVELWGIDASGNEIMFTKGGKIPLDISARLANNAYLIARNFADDGNVNILKVNTGNEIEFVSHPVAPDSDPTSELQYVPKKYIIKKVSVLPTPGTDNEGRLFLLQDVGTAPDGLYIPMDTGGNGFSNKKILAGAGVYDSGWFAIASNSNYAKTHNLGTTKLHITLMLASSDIGANAGEAYSWDAGGQYGASWYGLTSTVVGIRAWSLAATNLWDGSAYVAPTHARIIMLALE
jgi:hypothetical protein